MNKLNYVEKLQPLFNFYGDCSAVEDFLLLLVDDSLGVGGGLGVAGTGSGNKVEISFNGIGAL
jgi:hypothetical protein